MLCTLMHFISVYFYVYASVLWDQTSYCAFVYISNVRVDIRGCLLMLCTTLTHFISLFTFSCCFSDQLLHYTSWQQSCLFFCVLPFSRFTVMLCTFQMYLVDIFGDYLTRGTVFVANLGKKLICRVQTTYL